jgi:hypothetical protein
VLVLAINSTSFSRRLFLKEQLRKSVKKGQTLARIRD